MLTCRRLLGSDLLSAVCLSARQLHAAVAGRMPASGLHEQSAAGDRHQEAASTPSQPAESSSSGATATIDPGTSPQPRFVVPIRKKKEPVPLLLGLERVQEFSRLKKRAFPESVEASIKLGIDPKRTDQIVKGSVVLPHGTGKRVVIAVFADGQDAVTAREAGADIVGGAELVEKVKADKGLAADKVLATPGMLKQVSSVARILGPKGLMPNPKMGTVTNNVAATIEMMRHGQLQFRSDRRACINIAFGKVEFEKKHLEENLLHFLSNLVKLRPKGVKGSGMSGFVSQVVLSTTMGPGVPIELSSLSNPVQRQRTRTAQ